MKMQFSKKTIYKNLILALTLSLQPLLLDNAIAQSNVRIINSKNQVSSSVENINNAEVDEKVKAKAQARLKEVENNYRQEISQNYSDDTENITIKQPTKKFKTSKNSKNSKKEYVNGEFVGKTVDGMGSEVSYNEVISQVIPSNWKVSVDNEISSLMSAKTSWVGGKGWVKILKETFNNSGVAVIINVGKKHVHFQSELSFVAKSKGYGFQIFPTDKTLRAALSRWAQQAGYQFVWDVPRDIPNNGMYFASKKDLEGALDEIITAVNMDSDLHIAAVIHETEGQKVLRITKFIKEAGK